jgi:cell shape-determining protein MreC
MMMNYRRKNKKFTIVLSFIVFIIVLFSVINIVWPQGSARFIFAPMYKVREIVLYPFSSFTTSFKNKNDLENRIKELEEENAKLKISSIAQSFVSKQIEDYNLELEKNNQGMISKVLNRPPYSPYDTLLILKGGQNIEVGDLAFIRGVYIGDVESSDVYTAVVKLRSSSGQKTLIRISDIEIEAEGKGGGQFTVKIPKDSEIKTGDAVMAPLLNYSLLGSVGQVVEDPLATFKTVYFSVPVSFQDMNFVSILKKDSVLE